MFSRLHKYHRRDREHRSEEVEVKETKQMCIMISKRRKEIVFTIRHRINLEVVNTNQTYKLDSKVHLCVDT